MGLITPNDYKELQQLYTGQLLYLLSTENQIVKGLESMVGHTQDEQLRQAFQSHKQVTEMQAGRLETLISEMDGEVEDIKTPSSLF